MRLSPPLHLRSLFFLFFFLIFIFYFYNCIVPMGFSHGKFGLPFPEESQLRQSRATQPTVRDGCFSVSIIHRTRHGLRNL